MIEFMPERINLNNLLVYAHEINESIAMTKSISLTVELNAINITSLTLLTFLNLLTS